MPPGRLQPHDPAEIERAIAALRAGSVDAGELGLLVRHFLSVLSQRAPGRAVEVRVPPYGVVQCVGGASHSRGTPRAVVETDGTTWLALATGSLSWLQAVDAGRLVASGERSDLSAHLPLVHGE